MLLLCCWGVKTKAQREPLKHRNCIPSYHKAASPILCITLVSPTPPPTLPSPPPPPAKAYLLYHILILLLPIDCSAHSHVLLWLPNSEK